MVKRLTNKPLVKASPDSSKIKRKHAEIGDTTVAFQIGIVSSERTNRPTSTCQLTVMAKFIFEPSFDFCNCRIQIASIVSLETGTNFGEKGSSQKIK